MRGIGTAAQAARMTHYTCGETTDPEQLNPPNVPATVSVRGSVIELTAPYALGLRRGTKVVALVAAAAVQFVAFGPGTDPEEFFVDGDFAWGRTSYTLL